MQVTYCRLVLTLLLLFAGRNHLLGQNSKQLIKKGNEEFKKKNYSEAEVNYRKANGLKDETGISNYNLGSSYYMQDKYKEAAEEYRNSINNKNFSDTEKEKAYHNLGNALLKDKKYEESIKSFKEALKLNPKGEDTRYNLAYAQSMLRQQQEQQKQQQQKQNQDQQKQKQEQQQQKKQEQKQEQKQQEQQASKPKINKEEAEKMLNALNNDEKKTQKKLSKKEVSRISIEKQW